MANEKLAPQTSYTGTDNEEGRAESMAVGSVAEIHDLTQLGYKPEMVRNRSMLTLLFQSLAIAAIRKCNRTNLLDRHLSDIQHMERAVL